MASLAHWQSLQTRGDSTHVYSRRHYVSAVTQNFEDGMKPVSDFRYCSFWSQVLETSREAYDGGLLSQRRYCLQ